MQYAIIRTAGFQFRVEEGETLRIPSVEGDVGKKLTFDEVLLGSDGKKVKAGTPTLKGAKVTAHITRHGKGRKIVVFKQGHRQGYTEVKISDITLG